MRRLRQCWHEHRYFDPATRCGLPRNAVGRPAAVAGQPADVGQRVARASPWPPGHADGTDPARRGVALYRYIAARQAAGPACAQSHRLARDRGRAVFSRRRHDPNGLCRRRLCPAVVQRPQRRRRDYCQSFGGKHRPGGGDRAPSRPSRSSQRQRICGAQYGRPAGWGDDSAAAQCGTFGASASVVYRDASRGGKLSALPAGG